MLPFRYDSAVKFDVVDGTTPHHAVDDLTMKSRRFRMPSVVAIRRVAILLTLLAPLEMAWAQTGSTPRVLQELPSPGSTPAAKPALTPADQAIKDAYAKSKTASTLEDYSQVITSCQDGIDQGASGDNAAYAKKLQAWAYNRRGEKRIDAGDEKAALGDFETAVTLDPKLWKALHNRGVSRAATGDSKNAMSDFDTVVRLNPGYANAWFNRGELKYDQGDFAGALQDYNQAVQLQSGDSGFYISRAHALYRLGRSGEAMRDYNRAVQINPNDATALLNRGDAYREMAQYQQAASDYREAIRINPKLGRAYLSAAWLMATCPDARYRETDKAISAAQKAIELDGEKDYRYLDTLAAAQANAGRFEDAKNSATQAVSAAPSKELAHVRQRLELYESSRAYREGAPAEPVRAASVR